MKPFLRAFGNYDGDLASIDAGIAFPPEEGVTQQQFAEEVDINTIVARFGLTGELPINPRPPVSGDFVGITDYHSALNAVRNADAGFLEFPAELRARFGHDPQRLLEFLDDASNRDEAVKLGLVAKPPEVLHPAAPGDPPKA